MSLSDKLPRHPPLGTRGWGTVAGVALIMGLLESSKAYIVAGLTDVQATWLQALVGNLPWWFFWGLLTPGIFFLSRRWQLTGPRIWVSVLVHVPASILFTAVHLSTTAVLYRRTTAPEASLGPMLLSWINAFVFLEVATYWVVLTAYQSWSHYAQFREQQQAAAQLEIERERLVTEATRAKLRALQMELQPHFLFNTLNTITALVRQGDSRRATDMIVGLGDLLRRTLERGEEPLVPLEEEIELARCYLAIQKVRFPDLTTSMNIDPGVLTARVPTLLLQPLVENAIRHGLAGTGEGWIRIDARESNGRLEIGVTDSGSASVEGIMPDPSVSADEKNGRVRSGVGLANTRARLEQLWPGETHVELVPIPEGGTVVSIAMPAHHSEKPLFSMSPTGVVADGARP